MPNWTSNYIEAEGDPSDIRAFLEAIKGADTVLDFNRIVPMPELVKRTGSGRCTIDGKTVDTWYHTLDIVSSVQPSASLVAVDS